MDELKAVHLLEPWGDHQAGDLILVDPHRARQLIGRGMAEEPEAEKAMASPPADKMMRGAKFKK